MNGVRKVFKDFDRVKSIVKMAELLERRIKIQNKEEFSTLILSDYYEVIKELITALLLVGGGKTLSHIELIKSLRWYGCFTMFEVSLVDKLRVLRNKICYEGVVSRRDLLERNEGFYLIIIGKLKDLIVVGMRE